MNVPGYEVEGLIASGGFGEVWRANKLGDSFAIKVIRPVFSKDPELVGRFTREIALCVSLMHPHIIPIVDHGLTEEGAPFYVMPYVVGMTLHEHIRQAGRLAIERASELFASICAGIQFAHEAGIVHRDIKSSNVLIGEDGSVQICDFGLAKLLADDGPNLTRSREILGTPACMAPEQALGKGVDERTDVYSLGVLLYELLSGVLPFAETNATVLTQLHCYAQRPTLRADSEVPSAINQVLAKAMEIDPQLRYASATALAKAVAEILSPNASASEDSWLIRIECELPDLVDREDRLDEIQDRLESLGAGELIRAGRRLAMVIQTSLCTEASLQDSLPTRQGVSVVYQREALSWTGPNPRAGNFLEGEWPSFQEGTRRG